MEAFLFEYFKCSLFEWGHISLLCTNTWWRGWGEIHQNHFSRSLFLGSECDTSTLCLWRVLKWMQFELLLCTVPSEEWRVLEVSTHPRWSWGVVPPQVGAYSLNSTPPPRALLSVKIDLIYYVLIFFLYYPVANQWGHFRNWNTHKHSIFQNAPQDFTFCNCTSKHT